MAHRILQPGRNVWRIERTDRAAVLVDGAEFFGTLRRAFLNAQHSIFIVGWDIDSRTRLVGAGDPDDGYSPVLVEFLTELVQTRPSLHIYILLWDFTINYTAERELFPRLSLNWKTPDRVTLCMDSAVPFGSSQHQKLFIVDDALAFSGGLDITQRRWDTSEHAPDDRGRVDVAGRGYPPFHDVQIMVDGGAARAAAELARRRWCNAHGTDPPIAPHGDPWPKEIEPQFTNVDVGISRTLPAFGGQRRVSEVKNLFLDSIDSAERSIYIENQFMTSVDIARRIAKRLRQRAELEVIAVSPRSYESRVVAQTLGAERARFCRIITKAGGDRVRVMYPVVTDGSTTVPTMVHSKVMIVDDRFLRVGSANLNNRSMGVDTECDLAIEAASEADRAAITGVRNRLIADHCGVTAEAAAAAVAAHGSLIAAAERLSGSGHRLRDIEPVALPKSALSRALRIVVDPKKPLSLTALLSRLVRPTQRARVAGLLIAAIAILALSFVWYGTLLADFVTRERVQGVMSALAGTPWAPLWVLLTYLAGGLVAFPVLVLIVATATTFGPWLGFLYALLGVLASALAMYSIGALLGRDLMQSWLGPRWHTVRRALDDQGMLAVAAIRLVPVAPFTFVNLAAGACSIALLDYVAGTLIGMLPGLIAISALGHQITALFSDFSPRNVASLLLVALCWIALAWCIQVLVRRSRRRSA
jgi:phospholipase D1/2